MGSEEQFVLNRLLLLVPIKNLNPEAELPELESEFGKVAQDYSADEVDGWEFDELEKELR
ncbi:hypothetical protein Bca52824_005349 [Brassica carinata]|uniref:Uncharacterized protein n=1 Tax=Brassica carinata TaxID=52824 RepID=A0A8X7WNC0_BRACI|nr:hypothetical protein Bca52824_005349 [Brassica carinata]